SELDYSIQIVRRTDQRQWLRPKSMAAILPAGLLDRTPIASLRSGRPNRTRPPSASEGLHPRAHPEEERPAGILVESRHVRLGRITPDRRIEQVRRLSVDGQLWQDIVRVAGRKLMIGRLFDRERVDIAILRRHEPR